jgi:hypothetical protein
MRFLAPAPIGSRERREFSGALIGFRCDLVRGNLGLSAKRRVWRYQVSLECTFFRAALKRLPETSVNEPETLQSSQRRQRSH